jgi:hypothetical protein
MLLALAIAVSIQDARPPVVVTPVPPPLVRTEIVPPAPPAPPQPFRVPAWADRPATTFVVRVSIGSDRLVDERLRVGAQSANISQTRQEALAGDCPGLAASLNRQLNVSLRPDFASPQSTDRFRLDLRYSRPVQQGCDSGSRGLQLDQQFTLRPGQSLTLTGDAGLRVELRRE